MHELTLARRLVSAAVDRAAGRPVAALRIELGPSHVDAASLRFNLDVVATGTPLEGATVLITPCDDLPEDSARLVSVTVRSS